MAHDRIVAGLHCSEVLAHLSDFVDESLDSATRDRIVEHLRGCEWCERFGGRFSAIVRAIRHELKDPDALDDAVAERLRRALDRATR